MICLNCKKEKVVYKKEGLCRNCYSNKYYQRHKEKWRLWAKNNPEKKKLKDKKYRENHKEEIRKYRQKHREEKIIYMREYHKKNKERGKQYRRENTDRILLNVKKWRKTPNGLSCMRQHYIMRRTGRSVLNMKKVIHDNLMKYGVFCCEKCKKPTGNNFQIDHIIPVSKGGSNSHNNMQLLCPNCNIQKRTEIVDYRENQIFL